MYVWFFCLDISDKMFPAPFGHVKVKHHHKKWGSSSSSSSSSSGGGVNKAWKKEQKRQRKLMKKMAKHVCGFFSELYSLPVE